MILKKLSELDVLPNEVLEANGIELEHEDEIFVPLESWAKYYISNYGRLLSAKHNPWWVLNPTKTQEGYYVYRISDKDDHAKHTISAARLVCFAFYDIQYPRSLWPYLHAHHRNGVRTDNRAENIEPLLNNHHVFSHKSLELLLFRGKGLDADNINYKNVEDVLACEIGITLPELMDAIINAETMQPYADTGDMFAYKIVSINDNDATVFVRLIDDDWQQAMQQATADDTDNGGAE